MHTFNNSSSDMSDECRLTPGDVIPPRELTTISSERIRLPQPEMLTHVQFRRFAACPVCNVHLRSVTRRHQEIIAAGIRELVVFHSQVETMLPYQGELPFAAVADADRELYDEFGVRNSPKANPHPRVWSAPLKPQTWSVLATGWGGRP